MEFDDEMEKSGGNMVPQCVEHIISYAAQQDPPRTTAVYVMNENSLFKACIKCVFLM